MKTKDLINIAAAVLIVVFAAVSIGPCIKEIFIPIKAIGDDIGPYIKEYHGYSTVLCVFISVIELILLFGVNGRRSRIIGFVLNLLKIILPLRLYEILQPIGGLGGCSYELTPLGHVIRIIGVLICILYLIEIFHPEDKEKKQDIPLT